MNPAAAASALAVLALGTAAAAPAPTKQAPPQNAPAPAIDGLKAVGVYALTTETALVIRGVPGQLVVSTKPGRELRFASRAKDKSGSQRPLAVSFSGTTVTLSPPPGAALPEGTLRLEAPESFALRVETQDGTLLVDGFAGGVAIVAKGTVVRAQAIAGTLNADVVGGSLSLTNLSGAVTARTSASAALTATTLRGSFDLNSQDATFKVQDVGGACRLEARGGSGELAGLGAGGDLRLSETALRVSGAKGDVTVSSNAALVVSDMAGSLRFDLEGGTLRGQDIEGPVTVRSRRTDVSLEGVTGELNVDVTRGNVVLKHISGAVNALIFAGDAKLLELQGPVRLDMDGGTAAVSWIAIAGDRDSVLRNKGGGISVGLPGNASCRVSAKATSGRVLSDVPSIRASADGTAAEGAIGQGKQSLISIEADGNIHLTGGVAAAGAAVPAS